MIPDNQLKIVDYGKIFANLLNFIKDLLFIL